MQQNEWEYSITFFFFPTFLCNRSTKTQHATDLNVFTQEHI